MKKRRFFIGTGVIMLLLVGYWYLIRPHSLPSVKSALIAPTEDYGVITPDGNFIYDSLQTMIDLQTGSKLSNDLAYQFDLKAAWSFLNLSPNGRYLIAKSADGDHKYLLDLEEKTFHEESVLCESWSGNSNRCVETLRFQLAEIPDNRTVGDWNKSVDFRAVSNISGDGIFLWDDKQNIPIAEIYPCLNENRELTSSYCLVSLSYDYGFGDPSNSQQPTVIPILEIHPPREVASYIFDPTGKYVLFAIWEHKGEYDKYESGNFDKSTVVDTVLILVNWRTKQSKEILRISTLDQADVVASRGSLALDWSSDGSTILVYRYDAPAIILKMK